MKMLHSVKMEFLVFGWVGPLRDFNGFHVSYAILRRDWFKSVFIVISLIIIVIMNIVYIVIIIVIIIVIVIIMLQCWLYCC